MARIEMILSGDRGRPTDAGKSEDGSSRFKDKVQGKSARSMSTSCDKIYFDAVLACDFS